MKRFLKLKISDKTIVWVNLDLVREFVVSDTSLLIIYGSEVHSEWELWFDKDNDTRKIFLEKMAELEV